jgi:hypothetical protein
VRVQRTTNVPQPSGVITAYVGGLWEEDLGVAWRALYLFAGRVVAQRTSAGVVAYLHADALGSVSAATSSSGAVAPARRTARGECADGWGAADDPGLHRPAPGRHGAA